MTTASLQQRARRTRFLATVLIAPAVATGLGVTAIEGWRLRRPTAPLFAAPMVYSLADAIESGDVPQAYGFIRAGQDPNELIAVRHPVLTGRRWVLVSPLVWAVATNNRQAVLMLIGFGARMDRPADSRAVCLAEDLGHGEIAGLLRLHGNAPSAGTCPQRRTREAPLLSFLSEAE